MRSQALVVWCERSSFPQVWGWAGREHRCCTPSERSIRSKSASPLRLRRPVKQLPLSLMTRAGRPQSWAAAVKASHATLAVGPVSTRAATRAREWSSRTSMIHTVRPSASAQQVASICQASFGRGHSKRFQATFGRFSGRGVTIPRRTSTRWIVATEGTGSPRRARW